MKNNEKKKIFDDDRERIMYEKLVDSWINSRNEIDKTFITISAGSIGLLVVLSNFIDLMSFELKIWFFISSISFLFTILIVLYIFRLNRTYISKLIKCINDKNDVNEVENSPIAKRLYCADIIKTVCFIVGLVSILSFAIILIIYFK